MAQDTGIAAYASLGADINKQSGEMAPEAKEGIVSEKLSELRLDMKDEDLLNLTKKWKDAWDKSDAKAKWEKQCEENEKYWLGDQFQGPKLEGERPNVDNLIFEALETYLPQVTRRNPEPLVTLDSKEESTPAFEQYVQKVKNRLGDLADKNKLRLKLKKAARHWSIFLIAVAKFGWDLDKNMPITRIVRAKRIILDPDSTVDEDGYTGTYIGEYRKLPASSIISIIGDEPEGAEAKKAVEELVKEDTATMINFIEWWTPEYMCWQLGKKILLKKKNPHWNYDRTENPQPTDMASEGVQVDDYGNTTVQPVEVKGINHLASPEMPYKFLSIFNLGDQPMDKTSLIGQNLANQDRINKRNKQIDKNADSMNSGVVVSLSRSGLTQAQAKSVTEALRKGGAVVIPDGAPRDAIDRYPAPGLPPDVYNDLADTRSRFRDIFGIRGSSAAGLESENTVRGKIINRGTDTDRIGGGVSEYLEQFADDIYNWLLQLLYVYDDGFQFIGGGRPPKVCVSVKEGSLLPKDSTTIANQAIELGTSGKMALVDMYKRLEYPNPEELAANVWLETNAPEILYGNNPQVQQAMAMMQAAAAQGAVEEAAKGDKEHGQNMEKEKLKAAAKGGGSILSEVPQDSQV